MKWCEYCPQKENDEIVLTLSCNLLERKGFWNFKKCLKEIFELTLRNFPRQVFKQYMKNYSRKGNDKAPNHGATQI